MTTKEEIVAKFTNLSEEDYDYKKEEFDSDMCVHLDLVCGLWPLFLYSCPSVCGLVSSCSCVVFRPSACSVPCVRTCLRAVLLFVCLFVLFVCRVFTVLCDFVCGVVSRACGD